MSQQTNTIVLPIMNMGNAQAAVAQPSHNGMHAREVAQEGGKPSSVGGQGLPVRTPREQPEPPRNPEIEKIVQELNAVSVSIGRDLHFEVDLKTGISIIQVLDSETGEIIRQIPAEKVSSYLQSEGGLAIRLFDEHV